MIYVFIVDTSVHMNQETAMGSTLLSMAKKIVLSFTYVDMLGDSVP